VTTAENVVIGIFLVAVIALLSLVAFVVPLWPLWIPVAMLARALWILAS
jgi:hypothetical protein